MCRLPLILLALIFAVPAEARPGAKGGSPAPETAIEREFREQDAARHGREREAAFQRYFQNTLTYLGKQCGPLATGTDGQPIVYQLKEVPVYGPTSAYYYCADFYVRLSSGGLARSDCGARGLACP